MLIKKSTLLNCKLFDNFGLFTTFQVSRKTSIIVDDATLVMDH